MAFKSYMNQKQVYLNDEQMAAVNHDEGPGMVLATAGSGKTTVITARSARLVYDKRLELGRKILTITFSKMAAQHMKHRYLKAYPDLPQNQVNFSTIHAFSYRIVREYFKKKEIPIKLMQSNYDVIKNIMGQSENYKNEYQIAAEEVENMVSKISYVKNLRLNNDKEIAEKVGIRGFTDVYHGYEAYKKQMGMIDFDDMLVLSDQILGENIRISTKFKDFYQFIQLDEAQDTSPLQFDIIKKISNGNLFIVGDDDQAIYSFRGSSPKLMLQFKDNYKDAKIFGLNTNYRCNETVTSLAKICIERNRNRYVKAIKSEQTEMEGLSIRSVMTRRQQAEYIAQEIKKYPNQTVAILYRYNVSALIPAELFRRGNISFYVNDEGGKFFRSLLLKDLLAFFHLAVDPYNKNAFSQIYYKCQSYFTKEMRQFVMKHKGNVYKALKNFPKNDPLKMKNIKAFEEDMRYINTVQPLDAIGYIQFEMGYGHYLDRLEKEGRIHFATSQVHMEIVKEVAKGSNTISDFMTNLEDLQQCLTEAKNVMNAQVTLSSIHSTKGLEFDRVYMIDNIYGEFPVEGTSSKREVDEEILEEERRLFYVGMTRAIKRLEILYPEIPSRFVTEISDGMNEHKRKDFFQFKRMKHKFFGQGMIVSVDDDRIVFKNEVGKIYQLDMKSVVEKELLEPLGD